MKSGNVLMFVIIVLFCTGSVLEAQIVFIDDYSANATTGRFVMEAENYSNRILGGSSGWWEVDGSTNMFVEGPSQGTTAPMAESGARDNYMEMLGSYTGSSTAPTSDSYNGGFVDFKVLIETTGSYSLYARWAGHTYDTDSLYALMLKPDDTLLTGAGPNYFAYHDINLALIPNSWLSVCRERPV